MKRPIHVPIIHDLGTYKSELICDRLNAINKLESAKNALWRCSPKDRDFPFGSLGPAQAVHHRRMQMIRDLMTEIMNDLKWIEEQHDRRCN